MSARRRLAFVRALHKHGKAKLHENNLYVVQDSTRRATLPADMCDHLAHQGIISREEDALFPSAETGAWIRRQLAAGSEAFAAQHRTITHEGEGRQVNLDESPLSRIAAMPANRNLLQPHQLEAGERFRKIFERAALRQRTTMSFAPDRVAKSGKRAPANMELAGMNIDARREIDRIFAALPSECAGVVIDVCGFEKGLQQVERERGWPRRSAKLVLRIGLDQLARHFGLMPMATGAGGGRVNGWRQDGARPTELGWAD
jgi:hypothetical protein